MHKNILLHCVLLLNSGMKLLYVLSMNFSFLRLDGLQITTKYFRENITNCLACSTPSSKLENNFDQAQN